MESKVHETESSSHLSDSSNRGSLGSISTISRRFSRLSLRNSDTRSSSSEQETGPIGLNTLYVPPNGDAIADLIFVHGLGGGSRSTWTASNDPSLYWPQEWLPADHDFQQVRIHSFGYSSKWNKESILDVHDFANALLLSILNCPCIPSENRVSFVLMFTFFYFSFSPVW